MTRVHSDAEGVSVPTEGLSALISKLDALAGEFRARAEQQSEYLSGVHGGTVRELAADHMADFAETVAAIAKATGASA